MDGKVEVKGVRELQTALKRVDSDLPREMKAGFLRVAERLVKYIEPKVPRMTGAAASSVQARATQLGAGIRGGGNAAPWYPWLDFGGSVGRGHRPGQGGGAIRRPIIKSGRYIYPTVAQHEPDIREEVERFMDKLESTAGLS
jgi:hypothetical protein